LVDGLGLDDQASGNEQFRPHVAHEMAVALARERERGA
jgi:hypothetical protein